jgi:hypothetical protein
MDFTNEAKWFVVLQRHLIVDNLTSFIVECQTHDLCERGNCINQAHLSCVDCIVS